MQTVIEWPLTAVHVCHCMTRAPRIKGGETSAAKTGTVADLGPMPIPRKKRAMNRCHHEFVTADQIQVAPAKKVETKIALATTTNVSNYPQNFETKSGPATTEPAVEWVGKPAREYGRTEIRRRVDQSWFVLRGQLLKGLPTVLAHRRARCRASSLQQFQTAEDKRAGRR